ncbi:hypothetical protein ACFX2I_019800 [Malus domestica]
MSVTKEKTYFVDILVSLKESNEIGNASQDIRITEPFLAERIMHTDGNEFLGKFRTPNAKMYLSHPWKNYISNVDQDYEGGADEFRLKLCKYAVEMGFEFKKNGNQGLFPFAFALIDVEDEVNWTWFLMNLFAVLSEDERTITFLSNRHKGLLQYVWQVKGFPCSHAVAAIMHNSSNPYDYIEDYFIANYYKSSYSFPIERIPNIHQPPLDIVKDFVIKPLVTRKQPGKPRIKRIKSNREESRPMKCGKCKKLRHHNKNTCSAPL